MARRFGFGLLPLLVLAVALSSVSLLVRHAVVQAQAGSNAPACLGNLNQTTYTNGFKSSDFTSTTAADVGVPNGGIQLNTNLTPLNPEKIVLPFDQDVRMKSVYFNAGATHSLGWFYLDQIDGTKNANYWFDQASQTLVIDPGTGVPYLYENLWRTSGTSAPALLKSSTSYSDGGNFPHIPNLLEPYAANNTSGIGSLIFQLMNDNGSTGCTFTYNGVCLPPISDTSSAVDGIFDFHHDAFGNPLAGAPVASDRTVDLGTIQGGREIVFYVVVYWQQTGKNVAFGTTGNGTRTTGITPFFSKTALNIDFQSVGANDTISYIDIGAPAVKSTGSQCEDANPAASPGGVPTPLGSFSPCTWTPYPSNVSNDATQQYQVYGWLDQPTLNRLNTPTYNNLTLPNEVHRVQASAGGSAPHFFVGAPSNDQNRWIMGFEDLLGYSGNSCPSCTQSDFDWNDVVVVIERNNGGQVVSQNLVTGIPPAQLPNTMISRIRIRYTVTLPSPQCDNDASAGVHLYYSVDGGTTWSPVPMSNPLTGDVTIDVLAQGLVGNQLQWKATFTSATQQCQPVLNHVDVGYEAIQHGEYKFAAPIPMANMVYSGTVETPASTWTTTRNDFSLRGHFYAQQLFDPSNGNKDFNGGPTWDAGPVLAAKNPDTRYVITNNNGAVLPFTTANGATLYPLLLPSAIRGVLNSGKLVYDYTGDGVVDDNDAQFVLQWTRGWEYPSGIAITPAPPSQPLQRAWPLGPLHNSSPALIGPPGTPNWLNASGAGLSAYQSKFTIYKAANAQRKTIAVVGAQSGLIEAFNAGSFRQVPDPQCAVALARGCFATVGGGPDYGDGSEQWAYVPPSQLPMLKNNHPFTRSYLPGSNPTAEVDGSVSAEDIVDGSGNFVTGIFASLGRNQPYVTALKITTDPKAPTPLWANDFSDIDYLGSNFSPAVVPFAHTPGGIKSLVFFTSGQAPSSGGAVKTFLYVLDAASGTLVKNGATTIGKIALDTVGTSLGFGGYPNIVDANGDGIYDRVYMVDTVGRIWKVDLAAPNYKACQIQSVGESVFAGMAVSVVKTTPTPQVRIFLGGSPNPDGSNNPPIIAQYHMFAFNDNDPVGTCSNLAAQPVFNPAAVPINPPGGKLWAAPYITGSSPTGQVYFATANGTSESICDTGGGTFVTLGFDADKSGAVQYPNGVPINLAGEAVSSIRVYDGHALVNTVGGHTNIIGPKDSWNTSGGGGLGNNIPFVFHNSSWFEY